MKTKKVPDEILKILDTITNKRAKIVIQHISDKGFITTEQLEKHLDQTYSDLMRREDISQAGSIKKSKPRLIEQHKIINFLYRNPTNLEELGKKYNFNFLSRQ